MDRPATPSPPPSLADQFAAALDWWREAGVDADFHDEAVSLLAEVPAQTTDKSAPAPTPAAKPPAAPAPEVPSIGGDSGAWPKALPDFATWWLREPTLAAGPPTGRVPPRGVAQAELLVLVPMPENEDNDALLSGRQGQLVANMLRAMGVAPEASYVASALPSHTPVADWDGLRAAGLGRVLLHHIALAAPRRILVLGQDIMPLLGLEKRQGVRELPLAESPVPLLASLAPDILLGNSRSRADLWRRWLEWTGTA